ncbi:hypothetical protein BKA83DRAFT_679899 [Pisolithus microcarpus]|nr:hypothetical protein BKA83DRAFT_679899 [Pisolithus microcarpus]
MKQNKKCDALIDLKNWRSISADGIALGLTALACGGSSVSDKGVGLRCFAFTS